MGKVIEMFPKKLTIEKGTDSKDFTTKLARVKASLMKIDRHMQELKRLQLNIKPVNERGE